MSRVLDLRQADDLRDMIHRAVQLLADGDLVAFPTETVYVVAAHALQPNAVRRLQETVGSARVNGHGESPSNVLAVKSAAEALDYVPSMSPLGRKLCRRCWPGPVTLEFPVTEGEGLLPALPAETQAAVAPSGWVALRAPAHSAMSDVLRLMPAPLVLSADRNAGAVPWRTADETDRGVGPGCEMILDDGPCRYGEPSTVVRIEDHAWSIRSPGVVTDTAVGRLASEVFLFICTGNTCRSPLAEGIFRRMLSKRLKCTEEELFDKGYVVASAGLSAAPGHPAAAESVTVAGRMGVDLRSHESQPVSDRLLDQADHVFTMTRGHRQAILNARPDLADRVQMLSRQGADVSDPIGGGLGDYERCSQEIERHIRALIDEMTFP